MGELPPGMEEEGAPSVGTALDEFLPIYWHMARATKLHPAHTQPEVDALDLTVVAMFLGVRPEVPEDEHGALSGDFRADSAALLARRMAEAERRKREAASSV